MLYASYGGALNGVILRIVGDANIAEEVLQDVVIKIWNKIGQYDATKGRLFTWMMQLSRNAALDKLRSREISQKQKTDSIDNNVTRIEATHPVETIVPDVGLMKVLDSLREEERIVIDMVYFKGYTQSDVTKKTGIPLGTVKTRLRMALINLRKKINQ